MQSTYLFESIVKLHFEMLRDDALIEIFLTQSTTIF